MAKFRYRMQNILDVKEKLKTQAEAEYSAEMAKLNEEKSKLEELMLTRVEFEKQLKQLLVGKLDLRGIRLTKESIESVKIRIRDQMMAIQRQQRNVNIARQKLDLAQRDVKTHEILKEKAFEEFLKELNAEEMKQIDQLVSYTYGRKKSEDGEP